MGSTTENSANNELKEEMKAKHSDRKIILSDMSESMECFAIRLAVNAITNFKADKMRIATNIMEGFESQYGAPWHCILSNDSLGFCVHCENQLYCAVSGFNIYIFKNQFCDRKDIPDGKVKEPDAFIMSKVVPSDLQIVEREMSRDRVQYAIGLATDAIERYPEDMMHIAECIERGFEEVYGAPYHCVVSKGDMGFSVRCESQANIYFSMGGVTILLYRHQLGELQHSSLEQPVQSTMADNSHVIASGMPEEAQQYAIQIVLEGLQQRLENAKNVIARDVVQKFEEKYGPPFHCIISDGHLGFHVHYDSAQYCYFAVSDVTVFIFRHMDVSAPASRTGLYEPNGVPRNDLRISACGMSEEMKECAIDLAGEGIKSYPDEKMRIAQHIVSIFEEWYGSPYHCIVSDGDLGFYIKFDPARHIYFGLGEYSVFLFRHL